MILESLQSGTVVMPPRWAVFPKIVKHEKGGLLVEPARQEQ